MSPGSPGPGPAPRPGPGRPRPTGSPYQPTVSPMPAVELDEAEVLVLAAVLVPAGQGQQLTAAAGAEGGPVPLGARGELDRGRPAVGPGEPVVHAVARGQDRVGVDEGARAPVAHPGLPEVDPADGGVGVDRRAVPEPDPPVVADHRLGRTSRWRTADRPRWPGAPERSDRWPPRPGLPGRRRPPDGVDSTVTATVPGWTRRSRRGRRVSTTTGGSGLRAPERGRGAVVRPAMAAPTPRTTKAAFVLRRISCFRLLWVRASAEAVTRYTTLRGRRTPPVAGRGRAAARRSSAAPWSGAASSAGPWSWSWSSSWWWWSTRWS